MTHTFYKSTTYKIGPHPVDGGRDLANSYVTIVSSDAVVMDLDTGDLTESNGGRVKRIMLSGGRMGPNQSADLDALCYAAKKLIALGMPAWTSEKIDGTEKFKPSVALMFRGYRAQWANVRFPRRGGTEVLSPPDMLAAVLTHYTENKAKESI
ncbi:MAG: hypothetical protein WC700_17125 [Gemmatimonadaceae bacterium]